MSNEPQRNENFKKLNYKALSEKKLVFWIGGRLWELVAYERWSHMHEGSSIGHMFSYRADQYFLP